MSKFGKPRRPTVELQPSRIRREPPGRVPEKAVNPYPSEREAWTVVIGVAVFAVALAIIIVGISDWMNG